MNEVSNQPGQWPKGENLRIDSWMLQGLLTFGPAPLVVTRTARPLFSFFFFFFFFENSRQKSSSCDRRRRRRYADE